MDVECYKTIGEFSQVWDARDEDCSCDIESTNVLADGTCMRERFVHLDCFHETRSYWQILYMGEETYVFRVRCTADVLRFILCREIMNMRHGGDHVDVMQLLTEIVDWVDPLPRKLSAHMDTAMLHIERRMRAFEQAHRRAHPDVIRVKAVPDIRYYTIDSYEDYGRYDARYGSLNVFYYHGDSVVMCYVGHWIMTWGYAGKVKRLVSRALRFLVCGSGSGARREDLVSDVHSDPPGDGDGDDDDDAPGGNDDAPVVPATPKEPARTVRGYKITYSTPEQLTRSHWQTSASSIYPVLVELEVDESQGIVVPIESDDYCGKMRAASVRVVTQWKIVYNRANDSYMLQPFPDTRASLSLHNESWHNNSTKTVSTFDTGLTRACAPGLHFWATPHQALQFAGVPMHMVRNADEVL